MSVSLCVSLSLSGPGGVHPTGKDITCGNLKVCAWNCEGWRQKLDLKEMVCFCLFVLFYFYVLSVFSPCLKRSWIPNNSIARL